MTAIALTPVDIARITILMDNVTDPLVFQPSTSSARPGSTACTGAARITSAVSDEGLPDALSRSRASPHSCASASGRVTTRSSSTPG